MKMMNKKIKLIIFLFVLTLILGGFYINVVNRSNLKTGSFIIKEGSSSKEVFKQLEEEGFIKDAEITRYYSRFFHNSDFKQGKYEIPALELDDLIDYLSNSANIVQETTTITFIEGDWLKDMANRIATNTNLDAEGLLNYWNDENVIRSYMNDYPFLTEDIFNEDARYHLEGYLFPNTYEFFVDTNYDAVTRKMLNETLRIYNKYLESFNNSELSIHEIFTLASIVQYEAGKKEDMEKVAGVFFNRLNDGMKLQSSVTVCYALDLEDKSDWKQCEYNPDYDSPYNTYMYNGLPPGPILNPGEDALNAVLNPDENDYYYFVADVCGDGEVYYASTYAEHQENVRKYLWCY